MKTQHIPRLVTRTNGREHGRKSVKSSANYNTYIYEHFYDEKAALHSWAVSLPKIRDSKISSTQKAQQAIALTRSSQIVWPIVKLLGKEVRRFAWSERSLKGRLGLGGAAIGLAVFGGQGAGIAALGTAIGVPLWVVLGSGAAFAGVLIEEFTDKKGDVPTTTYKVIDAVKDE